MIRVGCCGWPVARSLYFQKFPTLEITSTFYNLPRLSTAENWRKQAPKEFIFSVKAWQIVTHISSSPTYERVHHKMTERELSRCGHFKSTPEVAQAWERTLEIARALDARFILLQTPPSFYPNADHLRDFYRFCREKDRAGLNLVWEPRGNGWESSMISRVCKDLNLIHAVDPMIEDSSHGVVGYFRINGKQRGGAIEYGHEYSEEELRRLLSRCGGMPAYVYFNNASMWNDAQRFLELSDASRRSLIPSHVRNLRPL